MLRKGVLIAIIAFVQEPRLRVYFCLWAMMLFLALQNACKPFDHAVANALECGSLVVFTLTLNVTLLWFVPHFITGPLPPLRVTAAAETPILRDAVRPATAGQCRLPSPRTTQWRHLDGGREVGLGVGVNVGV